jgi:tRNA(Ile)-lysidine synthase
MACLHLAWRAAVQNGWALHAVTVDHALRDGSAAEASAVAAFCKNLRIPHQSLRWEHGAVAGNLMDSARKARYALMAEWAAGQDISHILLGHTADDQAETFLMELARSAGIEGLSGMARHWDQAGVRFLRPFLRVSRADLQTYLTAKGVAWIDDPSNENDRFFRVKARRALKALQPLGITVATLGRVMGNLSQAQEVVAAASAAAAARICHEAAGEVVFDVAQWRATGNEVQRRLLIAALRWVSCAGYAPRGASVARVQAAIAQGKDATLAGCRIRVGPDVFAVVREPKAVAGLVADPGALWDGRWQVFGPLAAGQEIRALGSAGLGQCKSWRESGFSREALVVSPAIWYNEVLIAAPLAGFGAGFGARIVAPFSHFVLSH